LTAASTGDNGRSRRRPNPGNLKRPRKPTPGVHRNTAVPAIGVGAPALGRASPEPRTPDLGPRTSNPGPRIPDPGPAALTSFPPALRWRRCFRRPCGGNGVFLPSAGVGHSPGRCPGSTGKPV
jgi:hypothetical protein